ncbi:MAG: hypothetical protein ABIE22_01110 [archaeon]
MKKSVIILLILLVPLVSAISVDIKETYSPGETLIITIEGNFIDPVSTSNIYFYSGRDNIPMIYDLGKVQDKYYLYALLPTKSRDYTLLIKDAHFFDQGEKMQDLSYNFSVQGNTTDFSVSPGFIVTDKDFKITVQAIEPITVNVNYLDYSVNLPLSSGQKKDVEFSISNLNEFTVTEVSLSTLKTSYKVPAAVFAEAVENNSNISLNDKFRFSPEKIILSLEKDKEKLVNVSLINLGDEVEDITLTFPQKFSNILTLSTGQIPSLQKDQENVIQLTFKSNQSGNLSGILQAVSNELTASLEIELSVSQPVTNITPSDDDDDEPRNSCYNLGGYLCDSNEECSGYIDYSSDGDCCIGTCEEKGSSTSTIIGVILLLVAMGIVGFLVYRSRKNTQKSAKQILEKRKKDFEGRHKPTETKDSLSRT